MMKTKFEIIDAHTHAHSSRDAAQQFLRILDRDNPLGGSSEDNLAMMNAAGISRTLILPWVFGRQLFDQGVLGGSARDAKHVKEQIASKCSAYNRWATRIGRDHNERFLALCAVDPVLLGEDWTRTEINARLSDGALGLKIVPSHIRAYPSDDRLKVVWEEASTRQVPVLSQSGGQTIEDFAHPANFERILNDYPNLILVMAHMGMGAEKEVVRLATTYPNLHVDTSYWLGMVGQVGKYSLEDTASLFRSIGVEQVIFGTNYPVCNPKDFVAIMDRLPLSEDEQRQIFSDNFYRVFKPPSTK